MFAPIDVEGGERVDEQVGSAVVVVTLNHDIGQSRWLLIFVHRILKILLAEIAWKDQYVVIIARFVSEGLRNDVLFGEIEGTHRPLLITVEGLDWVFVA